MLTKIIAGGVVHNLPSDLKKSLKASQTVSTLWEDITPLARNEWICWVESAKQSETRQRRIAQTSSKLLAGKRRPCCWVGCMHRDKNGR